MVIDLIGGIFGKSESDKTAEQISSLKSTMPTEEEKAAALAERMSYMGLPGYENYQEQIDQVVPKTFREAEKVATSPSQLIQFGATALQQTNDAYNKLATSDATARIENMRNYQNVLQHKAGMALGIENQNNAIEMASINQEAQGSKDLISSVTRGVGSSINAYSTFKQLDYLDEQNQRLSSFFGTGGGRADASANATPNAPSVSTPPPTTPTVNNSPNPSIEQGVNDLMKSSDFYPINSSLPVVDKLDYNLEKGKNTMIIKSPWGIEFDYASMTSEERNAILNNNWNKFLQLRPGADKESVFDANGKIIPLK